MKIEIKEINKKSQLKISLLLLLVCYCNIDLIFRSLANGNCRNSSMSLLLVRNNSLVEELRYLTLIELYLRFTKNFVVSIIVLDQLNCPREMQ